MAYAAVATPNVLTDPGILYIAPLGTSVPTNTVAGSVFTDIPAAAFIPLGATEDGAEFSYSSKVEPIEVAEFLDPIKQVTVAREGGIAFNLAGYTLSNYRRALNGGVAALTPTTGTGATALYQFSPPAPGSETRCMILWESLDSTVRLLAFQTLQGGEVKSSFKKAPAYATIPCEFKFEVPASGVPFTLFTAGGARG